MSWWRRPPETSAPATIDPEGAAAAAKRSAQHLVEAQKRSDEVRSVAASLRDLRERNHFAELLAITMRRGT